MSAHVSQITTPVKIRKVLVLHVGGTIGMERDENGVYVPSPNKLFEKLKGSSQVHDASLAEHITLSANQLILPKVDDNVIIYDLCEYDPLLDSSNMTCKEWIRIATDIETQYNSFDGFVILHGTDTLAYTSSALSFMLEDIQKPVILTGSQIPIFETRTDALNNIISSLIFAGCYDIPEICLFFANKLFRGNRTVKISSTHLNAYDSPNYPPLALIETNITLNQQQIRKTQSKPLKVSKTLNSNVAVLTLFPTITACMFEAVVQCPAVAGLVIESYGVGNMPSNQKEIVDVIKKAVGNGIVIVNVTQCRQGTVVASYETGKALENIGVISGKDMTSEAALTKLCYVLGIPGLTYDEKVALMKENLRGELTNNPLS